MGTRQRAGCTCCLVNRCNLQQAIRRLRRKAARHWVAFPVL